MCRIMETVLSFLFGTLPLAINPCVSVGPIDILKNSQNTAQEYFILLHCPMFTKSTFAFFSLAAAAKAGDVQLVTFDGAGGELVVACVRVVARERVRCSGPWQHD